MAPYLYREYGEIVGGKLRPGRRKVHSLYFQIAAEHGLLGLLAFGGMMAASFAELQRARRRLKKSRPELSLLLTGLMLSLVLFLSTSLFIHASYVRYFWLFLGVAGAASGVLGAQALVMNFEGRAVDPDPEDGHPQPSG
jgi:O-antigen ligase